METHIDWKKLLSHIALPLGTGLLSALVTKSSMGAYQLLNKPPFAPPGILFPIVWTILFVLMGISSYLASSTPSGKYGGYPLYFAQLAVNFVCPILFFNLKWYLISFLWLLFLIFLVAALIFFFSKRRLLAGLLQIPYFLWLLYAGYLNFMISLLN